MPRPLRWFGSGHGGFEGLGCSLGVCADVRPSLAGCTGEQSLDGPSAVRGICRNLASQHRRIHIICTAIYLPQHSLQHAAHQSAVEGVDTRVPKRVAQLGGWESFGVTVFSKARACPPGSFHQLLRGFFYQTTWNQTSGSPSNRYHHRITGLAAPDALPEVRPNHKVKQTTGRPSRHRRTHPQTVSSPWTKLNITSPPAPSPQPMPPFLPTPSQHRRAQHAYSHRGCTSLGCQSH
jgi:hypothetical protein